MTFDAGRIRHDMSLMHYSRMSNGVAVPSNWRPAATGDTGVTWSPESATSVSYGSNSNDVSTSSAGGASSLAARTDHTHRGVRSVSVASNTLVGDVTLLAQGSVGITVNGQTIAVNVAPVTGGGASVSYGSNSNEVSYANAPGVSSLVSRVDHVHKGVTSVSHASNTFSGPVILTASGSLGITVPTPGTFNLSAVAGSSGGGGGAGVTQAYVGYNTIGATFENVTNKRYYCKTITLAATGLMTNIEAYIRNNADAVSGVIVALLEDNAGAPGVLVAGSGDNSGTGTYFSNSGSMPSAGRWFGGPIGKVLTAGTYWICIQFGSTAPSIAYDAGGDKTFDPSVFAITGAYPSAWGITTGSREYSLRANIQS